MQQHKEKHMKLRLLIAAWNNIPVQHRIYFAIIVGVAFITALLLGYGAEAASWLTG